MTVAEFSPDIAELLKLLGEHGVRYLIVGGQAVIHHGYPRLTGDVDIFYDRAEDNVARLYAALRTFWGGDVPAVKEAHLLSEANLVVQFGRPPNRVDLLSSLGSVAFEAAWCNRVPASIRLQRGEIPVSFIGLRELIQSKRDAGRHKDLADIENLPDPGRSP